MEAAITAQMSMARLDAAMGMAKASNDLDKALVNMLDQMARNVPVSETRGVNVNISG